MSCVQRRYKVLTSFHDVHTSGHLVRQQGQTVGRTERKSDAERDREYIAPHTHTSAVRLAVFTVSRAFNQKSPF